MAVGCTIRFAVRLFAALLLLSSFALAPVRAASIDDLLRTESDKVQALVAQGKYKAALAPGRRLVTKARKLLRKDDPRLTIYAIQLADLHDRAGNDKIAAATAVEATKLTPAREGATQDLIFGYRRLAEILVKNGKFQAAAEVLNRAIAIAEFVKGPGSVWVTELQKSLVGVYEKLGRMADAESLKQRLDADQLAAIRQNGETQFQIVVGEPRAAKAAPEATPAAPAPDLSAGQGAPAPEPPADQSMALPPPPPSSDISPGAGISDETGGAMQPEAESEPQTDGAPSPKAETAKPSPAKPEAAPKTTRKRAIAKDGAGNSAITSQQPTAAPEAKPSPDPNAQFSVVPVFYGTNRKPADTPNRVSYSSSENNALSIGMAMVTVPNTHVVPQLERPWELRVPGTEIVLTFESQDPTKHFTIKSIEALSQDQFIARAKARVTAARTYKGQALVFVHGFYNTFDDALYRTAQMAYDLQFDGGAFMYSWPSAGTLDAYRTDRPKAQNAGAKLREFLTLVATKTGATRVSVIAHSMGNLPLLEALDETVPLTGPSPSAAIDEVVLAAPDIGRKEFTTLVEHMKKVRGGITLYAASNDVALEASRTFFNNEPRAGDSSYGGPLLLPHVDTIDATRASTQFFRLNHYYVAESSPILCDVEHLLRGGQRPPNERSKILATVTSGAGTYYAYRP